MKKLLFVIVCVTCFFAIGIDVQEYPEVVEDEDNFSIVIPYIEYEWAYDDDEDEDEDDTRAVSMELRASKDSNELNFTVVDSTLLDVDVDTPAAIEGEGACSSTTSAQLLSCRADVRNSYFELQADCFNYSDPEDQQECFEEAEEERTGGFEECGDIEEAHENLCSIFGEGAYDPDMEDIAFLTVAEIATSPNPFLPLIPGNRWVYEGEDEIITVTVLDETKEILGIEAIVVQDVAEEEGEVVEDTFDWYAQDEDGNVWYMGELSRNFEDSELADIEGSWEAGVDGAKAGILFRATPVVGETLRQEYRIGEAEDIGHTLAIDATESTDAGFSCSDNCMQSLEYTPLEPDEEEHKFYLPGTGLMLEVELESGNRVELVDFTSGG